MALRIETNHFEMNLSRYGGDVALFRWGFGWLFEWHSGLELSHYNFFRTEGGRSTVEDTRVAERYIRIGRLSLTLDAFRPVKRGATQTEARTAL